MMSAEKSFVEKAEVLCSIKTGLPEDPQKKGPPLKGIKTGNINVTRFSLEVKSVGMIYTSALAYDPLPPGAVLVTRLGSQHTAVVVPQSETPLVATNQFFILQVKPAYGALLLPPYLAWYLNFVAKKELQVSSQGRAVPTLSISVLQKQSIVVPSLEVQKQVVKLFQDLLKEEVLFEELQQGRKEALALLISQLKK